MKSIVLSVCLMTILTGCGVEWFPDDNSTTTSVSIVTTTLADAPTGLSYSQTLTASGGTKPYKWAIEGALPDGLLPITADGTISGNPSVLTTTAPATAMYTFIVKVTDSATTPVTATKSLSIFTPTTGRMNDPTVKVYAENLTFDTTQGLTFTVKNNDIVVHSIQVEVTDYDNDGKVLHSPFPMTAVTVQAGLSSPFTNPLPAGFTVNNWRITRVSIL